MLPTDEDVTASVAEGVVAGAVGIVVVAGSVHGDTEGVGERQRGVVGALAQVAYLMLADAAHPSTQLLKSWQRKLTALVRCLNHDVLDVVAAVPAEDIDQALRALLALGRDGSVLVLLGMADKVEGRLAALGLSGRSSDDGGSLSDSEGDGELHGGLSLMDISRKRFPKTTTADTVPFYNQNRPTVAGDRHTSQDGISASGHRDGQG